MTTKTTEDRVRKICIEHLGVDPARVTAESKIEADLGADSLDFVELVMALEEEFEIEIPDTDAEKIVTVADAIAYVDSHD